MIPFFDLFKIAPEQMRGLVGLALSRGGDYADLFFEYATSEELTLRDGEVNAVDRSADYGVGIRVIKDGSTGYAYSESTAQKDMERAALTAAAIAESGKDVSVRIPEIRPVGFNDRYPVRLSWEDFTIESRKEYLRKMNAGILALGGTISKVSANLSHDISRVMFFNSLGDFFCDERPSTSLIASCSLTRDGLVETLTVSRSHRMGGEMLTDGLIDTIVNEIESRLPHIFEARQPKGGEMSVVMGAGSSGILLHEAIGHAFEADFNRKGISVFSDRMGKKICSEKISVVDDGTIEANRGAVNVDDEGVPGQKTYMVKEGILTSYLHDRISARHYGVAPTGNGRRESFRYNPIPRMRATYMENGDCTPEEIIHSVKKGIYVDNFTNGEVEIGAGDFTFYVKSGFLIENGRLTAPIKDTNIIGNGPEALADIIAVADDSIIDNSTWTCGKDQYCAVSCGMPTVLVKSLVVGGEV